MDYSKMSTLDLCREFRDIIYDARDQGRLDEVEFDALAEGYARLRVFWQITERDSKEMSNND